MNHILINVAVFAGCYGVAMVHHFIVHRKHPDPTQHGAMAFVAGVINPATMDALRDFGIHIVVYSGYIIPNH